MCRKIWGKKFPRRLHTSQNFSYHFTSTMNTSLNKVVSRDTEKSEKEFNYEIGVCRTLMKMFGLWIYEKKHAWIEILCNIQTSVIFAYLIIVCNIPSISALIKVRGYLILMIDNLIATVPLICVDFQLITLWLKKKDIAILFEMMVNNWHERKRPDERFIMVRYATISRSLACLGLFFIFVIIGIIISAASLGKLIRTETNITDISDYLLQMQSSYFYDITKGHRYILTNLSQLIYIIISGLFCTLPNGLFGVLVLHTCAQLEIMAGRLKTIATESKLDFLALKSLILKHYDIIRCIAVVEDIFNLLLLSLVFFFIIVFTILAFQVMSVFTDDTKMSFIQTNFYVMYVMTYMFLMFIYSWVGQNLIDQCENLNLALYDCGWYSLSSNQSRHLKLILIRSQQPLVITIGKVAPVKFESFLQLMKTCAGYISFLAAIKN